MNELDRAKEFEQAWKRQGLPLNNGPDAGDAVLLSHRGQILADLIALCERQQAELRALRVLRDVHAPAASDEPGDDGVVVEWAGRYERCPDVCCNFEPGCEACVKFRKRGGLPAFETGDDDD